MKAMIILLTGPMMLFFTLSAFSTIEYCVEQGEVIPWTPLVGIVAMDVTWCVCAFKCGKEDMGKALRKYERFLDRLL